MSTKQKTLAFVGLGVMGFPMAGHLAKAGYKVKVFNRTVSVCLLYTSDAADDP